MPRLCIHWMLLQKPSDAATSVNGVQICAGRDGATAASATPKASERIDAKR
ncbi:MAG: hypothetical protein KJ018_13685 [Burkholderiales bacterium]|nr:hypothetical protein [Burkholderiales bacterium]